MLVFNFLWASLRSSPASGRAERGRPRFYTQTSAEPYLYSYTHIPSWFLVFLVHDI